jgi:ERCC4-type nuclease
MTHVKTNQIKNAYNKYDNSYNYCLFDCYNKYSSNKEDAFNYCRKLLIDYDGSGLKIISFNSHYFSAGFIADMADQKTGKIKKAFIYITKNYDRYIFLDEI